MTFYLLKTTNMSYKIIIGIPSYNEQDSIAFVVKQIDKGIQKLYNPAKCLIVNLDSDSEDKTREVFLKTHTQTSKEYINTGSQPRGKGKNLLQLFHLCQDLCSEYVVTIDADIKTINPNWIHFLLNPLIKEKVDYCVPVYSRNRFEGNITNHFAYPLILGIYGVEIRQPIGGDFGISKRFYKYLLKQPIHETTLTFGIDIFMTCHAIGGGFGLKQIYLGRKFHRPSFYHMVPTFQDVFESGVYVTRFYRLNKHKYPFKMLKINKQKMRGIDRAKYYPHKDDVPNLLRESKKTFLKHQNEYKNYLEEEILKPLTKVIEVGKPILSADIWTSVLASFLKICYKENFNVKKLPSVSNLITPIYLWRAASFWEEIEFATPNDAENKIRDQARLLKSKIE